MYAVIETGGKQYRVEVGTELAVELLDAQPGDQITLDRVLLVADGDQAAVGRPIVDGASVAATVVRLDRADKVIVFKYKPKARTRVKKGHRQEQTILRITDVLLNGKSAAADVAAAGAAEASARQEAAAAAAEQAAKDAALAAILAEKAGATEAAEAPEPKKITRTRAKAASAGDAAAEDAEAAAPEADADEAKSAPKRRRAPKKED